MLPALPIGHIHELKLLVWPGGAVKVEGDGAWLRLHLFRYLCPTSLKRVEPVFWDVVKQIHKGNRHCFLLLSLLLISWTCGARARLCPRFYKPHPRPRCKHILPPHAILSLSTDCRRCVREGRRAAADRLLAALRRRCRRQCRRARRH